MSGRYISTDNAYVGAQKVLITPDISGKIAKVTVTEGQRVNAGDALIEIDPEPFRISRDAGRGAARRRAHRIRQPEDQSRLDWRGASRSRARPSI